MSGYTYLFAALLTFTISNSLLANTPGLDQDTNNRAQRREQTQDQYNANRNIIDESRDNVGFDDDEFDIFADLDDEDDDF
ncbi:MAG: hypothetical protein H6679_05215 [Epsilonproteobacteria bacterium]|nr:hypothetical protein [Campylobacterota bacterium]